MSINSLITLALLGVPIVLWKHGKDLFGDECHFTMDGHQRMAEMMADRIRAFGL